MVSMCVGSLDHLSEQYTTQLRALNFLIDLYYSFLTFFKTIVYDNY